jgi:sugar phosphate isomerase/epimerase
MKTRREFLGAAAAFVAAGPFARAAGAPASLRHPLSGTLGLQLYSLRHLFKSGKGDVAGTLRMIRNWGFTVVEGGGSYGRTPSEFAAMLAEFGLRTASVGADFDKLGGAADEVIKNAQAFGAEHVMCSWIPHRQRFSAADAENAASVFNAAGRKLRDAGLRLAYHIHGYEFQAGPDGTLFDVIARNTDAAVVDFEMDVFWVVRGGGDPLGLFKAYPGRFSMMHVKDIRKGTLLCDPTGRAPDETSVVLGEGMVDWPGVLGEANRQRVKYYFIEDEHPEAEKQVPKSLAYLAGLSLR